MAHMIDFGRHGCRSNNEGICASITCPHLTGVNLPAPTTGAPVRGAVATLRDVRRYAETWRTVRAGAEAHGLAGVLRGLARIAHKRDAARLNVYAGEVGKAEQGAEKRRQQARDAQARKIAAQASLIAKRSSMELAYTVAVLFKRGAHDVRIVRVGALPAGYSEARVAVKVRGDAPALRYREAETLAANVARKLAANAAGRRRA